MQYGANAPKTGKIKGQDCNRYGRTDEKLTGKQIKKSKVFNYKKPCFERYKIYTSKSCTYVVLCVVYSN